MEMGRRLWMSWEMGVFLAHAKITPEHVAHIAEELDVDGLIQAVLCVQGSPHIGRQLFIIEGRTGHQLHQDKQHQQNCQQCEQRGQDSLERIFFHVGWTPFSFRDLAVSRSSAADRHNAKKAHSGSLRATVRPCSAIQLFTRSWWCSCTHGSERRGDARHP